MVVDGTHAALLFWMSHWLISLHRYAIERTSTFISVWFWSRNAANVPADVKAGGTAVNTGNWVSRSPGWCWYKSSFFWQGTPAANFPNTSCNIAQFFDANNIIINLTFCAFLPSLSVLMNSHFSRRRRLGRPGCYLRRFRMPVNL
jgi:hypothetical protein